jgi:predicted phosphodiesterase
MRLLAISDLHVSHRPNREALEELPEHPDDWLIVAGDVSERPEHLDATLALLTARFAQVVWMAGNHDLWITAQATDGLRGVARYEQLVAICRSRGVLTPEDPYAEWPDGTGTRIVPLCLLFDYSFRPPDVPAGEARRWARASGVLSSDEHMLAADPFPSVADWCRARCDDAEARLTALPAHTPTVLANHWPLRYDLSRPPRIPRYSLWSGTMRTEHWARRFHARAVVSGHLHFRTTLWREGVRFDEVSLGYPRDWRRERGIEWYLREVLPATSPETLRFVPPRDPFLSTAETYG